MGAPLFYKRVVLMKKKLISVFAVIALASGFSYLMFAADKTPQKTPVKPPQAIKLPAAKADGGMAVEKTLASRRSSRAIEDKPISLETLSQLVWAAQGTTDDKGHRTAPSARALYSLETYVVVGNVTGLASGLYKYATAKHELILVRAGDLRAELVANAAKQEWIKSAPAIIILSGVASRMVMKDGAKMTKFMYVEAGLAAENFFLQVVSLGLGSTYVGGFDVDKTREFLGASADEEPIAVLPAGYKKP